MASVPDAGVHGNYFARSSTPPVPRRIFVVDGKGLGLPLPGDPLHVYVLIQGKLHKHPQLRIEPGLTGQLSLYYFCGRLAVLGAA